MGNIFNFGIEEFLGMISGKKKEKKKGGMLNNLPDIPPEHEKAIKKHFDKLLKNNDVLMFSTTTCPHCVTSGDTLSRNNIRYKKVNFNNYMEYEGDYMMLGPYLYKYAFEYTGLKSVPNIIVKE